MISRKHTCYQFPPPPPPFAPCTVSSAGTAKALTERNLEYHRISRRLAYALDGSRNAEGAGEPAAIVMQRLEAPAFVKPAKMHSLSDHMQGLCPDHHQHTSLIHALSALDPPYRFNCHVHAGPSQQANLHRLKLQASSFISVGLILISLLLCPSGRLLQQKSVVLSNGSHLGAVEALLIWEGLPGM